MHLECIFVLLPTVHFIVISVSTYCAAVDVQRPTEVPSSKLCLYPLTAFVRSRFHWLNVIDTQGAGSHWIITHCRGDYSHSQPLTNIVYVLPFTMTSEVQKSQFWTDDICLYITFSAFLKMYFYCTFKASILHQT